MSAPDQITDIWMPPNWEVGDGIIPVDAQAEDDDLHYVLADLIPAMIAEAVAKEREACAVIADDVYSSYDDCTLGAKIAADAIRNRKGTPT